MKIEIVDYLKAFHGDDPHAKAIASLHYGIEYLADALREYEKVFAMLEADESDDKTVASMEKCANSSLLSAKRFIQGYRKGAKS